MAVTAIQSPTTPNITGTNLVYVLSSSLAGSPQYRFVTDIYESGSNDYITTLKTYPNISGLGVIDVARELDDQLQYDNFWKVATDGVTPTNAVKTFNLKFGEEYGTSISSSTTIYTGSSDNLLQVFPGKYNNNYDSFNFNTSSIVSRNNILSNTPEALIDPSDEQRLYVGYDDYHTITILDEDNYIQANFYDINGSSIAGIGFNNNPAFSTVGLGPQNMKDRGVSQATLDQTAYIQIEFTNQPKYTLTLPSYPSYPCTDEYTRFAWINQYGFWDYYNVFTQLRRSTDIQRNTYDKTNVRYSDSIGGYNVTERGTKQYLTSYDDNFEITTDYLTKETADWVKEIFESDDVYIQSGSDFVPIIITNRDFAINNSTVRNKLFQYTIQFKYANKRESR